jgi:hypothetical protein
MGTELSTAWTRLEEPRPDDESGSMPDKTHALLDFLVLGHSPEGATGWPHLVTISMHPLAAGENVTAIDLIGAYRLRFGHQPRVESSADHTF